MQLIVIAVFFWVLFFVQLIVNLIRLVKGTSKLNVKQIVINLGLIIALYLLVFYGQKRELYGPDYSKYSVNDCDKKRDSEERELCYLKVAEAQKDVSICEKINKDSIDYYGQCYYNVLIQLEGVNSLICEHVPASPARDNCYYWSSRNQNNVSICEKIQDAVTKSECINDIDLTDSP